uniref:Uncharacterized protein n=1 Tax=Oryza brachyantha TaxID=4533 RepID=J3NBF9_ORYBR
MCHLGCIIGCPFCLVFSFFFLSLPLCCAVFACVVRAIAFGFLNFIIFEKLFGGIIFLYKI